MCGIIDMEKQIIFYVRVITMQKFIEYIYNKHKWDLDMFGSTPEHYDDLIRDSYIYAWFTKTTPKKYFYIGRGKGTRYNYILKDIEKIKMVKRKGYHYKLLQENLGIDYEFLYENLTQKERSIYNIKFIE